LLATTYASEIAPSLIQHLLQVKVDASRRWLEEILTSFPTTVTAERARLALSRY